MAELGFEELDALRLKVAERLGWTDLEYSASGILVGRAPGRKAIKAVPSYSVKVEDAWQIVDFLSVRGIDCKIVNRSIGGYIRNYIVEFGNDKTPVAASHRKLMVAICIAFVELAQKRSFDCANVRL